MRQGEVWKRTKRKPPLSSRSSQSSAICRPFVRNKSESTHAEFCCAKPQIGLRIIIYIIRYSKLLEYSVSNLPNLHHNYSLSADTSLSSLVNHSRVWTDPIGYYTTFADAGFAILAGELAFIHLEVSRAVGR